MPVTYRDKWNQVVHGTTNLTIYRPTGAQVGDLLLACFALVEPSFELSVSINAPTGWTIIYANGMFNNVAYVCSYYRIMQSGDPSSWTWTVNRTVDAVLSCLAFYGHDNIYPIGDKSSNIETDSDLYITATGINMPRSGIIVGHFGAFHIRSGSFTPPTGMNEVVDQTTTRHLAYKAFHELVYQSVGQGSTGSKTTTIVIDGGYISGGAAHLIGIQESLPVASGYHMII